MSLLIQFRPASRSVELVGTISLSKESNLRSDSLQRGSEAGISSKGRIPPPVLRSLSSVLDMDGWMGAGVADGSVWLARVVIDYDNERGSILSGSGTAQLHPIHERGITSTCFETSSHSLWTASLDGVVRSWVVETGMCSSTLQAFSGSTPLMISSSHSPLSKQSVESETLHRSSYLSAMDAPRRTQAWGL